MKRYIRATNFSEEDFRPEPFTKASVEDIVEDLWMKVKDYFWRRYKKISVDMDDLSFDENMMAVTVNVYNNDVLKRSGRFEFVPYSDYFDEEDYQQHLNTSMMRFIRSL